MKAAVCTAIANAFCELRIIEERETASYFHQGIIKSSSMHYVFIITFFAALLAGKSKNEIGLAGHQFFALSVSNADSVSTWYENVFQLKLLKEIRMPDGSGHVRIIGNENLMIEIVQHKGSKSHLHCSGLHCGE